VTPALLYAVVSAVAVFLGGAAVLAVAPRSAAAQHALIGFGAGYMLALVVVGMIPHALHGGAEGALAIVLAGYLGVHLLQHMLTPHSHTGEATRTHAVAGRWVGISTLAGLFLHSFFDGVAIASGFGVSAALGMLVFAGVALHKVPEGVTVASVMLASGSGRGGTVVGLALLAAATVFGVLLTGWVEALQRHGLALSAGVTLYVAASILVPEVQHHRRGTTVLAIFAGVGLFFLARLLVVQIHP
jgi:zinc transporter ZupT